MRVRRTWTGLLTTGALVLASLAWSPSAFGVSVTSASFSGGAGTYRAADGTLYAKQGAALTLTVNTDANTQCVQVIDGTGTVVATQSVDKGAQTTWTFSGSSYPWLTAAAGNGLVSFTTKAFKTANANGACKANQGEAFGVQTAAYTLDNTAPTVSAAVTPSPNDAMWNNSDVTLTWTADDPGGSGVKDVSPATVTVTTDGTVTKTATATDNVGNTATSAPVTVNLDKTAPVITGSRTPAANRNGWNNTDVTVSFSASDATSGLKKSSDPTTLTADGANQSVTGKATDNADNTSSTTVGDINIDKVAPTLSGAPTTRPNGNGWYNGDVTISWKAQDALSGTADPADSTVTGEGRGLTASATATDKAGNSTNAVSAPVDIDRTAPNTTVSAPPAWNKSDVTLTLAANDALSGVDKTYYVLDDGPQTAGTSVPVTAEGNHTLRFWSTDLAGNTEGAHTVSFGIDKTSPTIGHTQDPAANRNGWNHTDVTVTFTCSDALSSVAGCTAPQTVSTEGKDQVVVGTVTDNAGNSATDPASVSIDKTKPVISVDPLPAPDKYGWYGDDVTATYTAWDELSGVETQDRAHTFGEGADQTGTATATDAAGNSASVTTPVVNVDKTAPTITGTVVGTPNANGWFAGDVTVHWTCSDNLSGVVACPDDSVVTGEGDNLSASASVTDKAGHTSTTTVDGIKIDRSAPTTAASGVPGGWVNAPVAVSLSGSDNLSGIGSTYYTVDGAETAAKGDTVTIGSEGVHTVKYWSVDNAGNKEDEQSFTVEVDLSSPSIASSQAPVPNAAGWNNTDVAVSFSCIDQVDLSGLQDCTAPETVTTEGRAQKVTGTAIDRAGNSVTATATVNIDKTPPAITGAPDRPANANGWYNDDVTVAFVGSDALSGIAGVTAPVHLREGGDQSVTGTATDNADNIATTTVTGINVDETAPDLSAAPTTSPNENGWYNTDVTEAWAADDGLSGLAGAKPADSVISTEGEGQTASATVSDKAGNTTTATSAPVRIDKTAPSTDVSAPGGWVNGNVDVTLDPHDALSGVAATHFSVDGGPDRTGTTVSLTDEGSHEIAYYSVDKAGNVEKTNTVTVKIDKTAPTISHELSPKANDNGWNDSDVTVTFTCDDQANLSGIASCTAPQTVDREGRDIEVAGTATDKAGNSATDRATVSVDKTKPTITGSRTPAANDNGWNNTGVTVHFAGEDSLSGIDHVTPDETLGEGPDQAVEGTAVDAAGNSASATVGGINVDETPPTLVGRATTGANDNGWYNDDVTIDWTAGDELSGVDSPADTKITGEGRGLKATATVVDKAGNSTTADSVPVNIDRTAPTTGVDAPKGWNNSSVTVSLEPSDGLSGVAATHYTIDHGDTRTGTALTIDTEGVHTLTYWSVDEAGNAEAPQTVTVRIDLTRPTIHHTVVPAANTAGWNNTPVTISYGCEDALSGVAGCSPDARISTDGQDQSVPGTAVDNAGNSQTDNAKVSIDTVKPSIAAAPDRAPNGNGWYAGDVTVGFSCDDALSGIAGCTSPVKLGEGKDQSARGTATDTAGNTRDAVFGPVNVDETAPTLSGAPTTAPNRKGWYNGDVTIKWTAGDALSGIDGGAPADSVITSEGPDLTAAASVRDLAGNEVSAKSTPVKIDRTAPSTTVSAVSDWSNSDVTVKLDASDNLSGVAVTHYQLDDAAVADGTSVTIDSEGVHTLQVWSVDDAGNVEAQKNVEVKIDKTAPGISHAQSPVANQHGWNNSDVTVTFTCTDGGSGIHSCTGTQKVTTEGPDQSVLGEAVDNAGNTATDPVKVSIDKTKPTVSGTLSAAPNANGWFKSDVTATFTCADQNGLSGVLSCPSAKTFGEGADQSISGTATDAADNLSDVFSLDGVNVDETAPTLRGEATTSPNDNGWYRGDVTVRWTAGDALSGVDDATAPADSTITGEGDDLSVGAAVSDKAGNTRSAGVGGVRIDRHDPTTKATAPSGWQRSDVTVELTASDNLSGVAATHYRVDGGDTQDGTTVTVTSEGTHTVTYWSVDKAGNVETAQTVTVLVDKTPPTITGKATTQPNENGWYNAPVTVHFDCADAVSGISSCQPDATVSAEGANQSVTGTAVDNAGNKGATTVSGISVDTVKPVVTIGGVADGATYTIGAVPKATASATDTTSGLAAPATGMLTGGTSNGVGTFTYTATATDKAGNTGTAAVTYRVLYGYGATLFLQPVNDTAHQTGTSTSMFKAGQTIPLKFQLRNAGGTVIQAGTAPRWLTPVKGGATSAAVNESAYGDAGDSGSTYRWDGTQYIYNWNTSSSQAGYYWRVGVTLDDGQTYHVNIGLR